MRPDWIFPPDRGGPAPEESRLFLPGWGFPGRVLLLAEAPPAWAFPDFVPDLATLADQLLALLDLRGLSRIHLIGWSLGAHLALDFALTHPERVASLELLAIRSFWPQQEIEAIRLALRQGPADFLRDFYRKCFLGYKKESRRFLDGEQEALLADCDLPLLERGLAYLESWRLPPAKPDCPTRCWHGRRDLIAPFAERALLAGAECRILEHGGHPVFLDRECASL